MQTEEGSVAMEVVCAIQDIVEAELANNVEYSSLLQRALKLMPELRPDPEAPESVEVPGCRHLPRTLSLGAASPAASVADAIGRLAPSLAWQQNPRYNVGNKGALFMENYGWSSLGLTGNEKMAFGVLLLGPGVEYPPTSYESEGLFIVIGGSPEWKLGDAAWRRVNAGDVICRPFGGSEGKRPGNEPMLALYAWMYR